MRDYDGELTNNGHPHDGTNRYHTGQEDDAHARILSVQEHETVRGGVYGAAYLQEQEGLTSDGKY